MAFSADVLGPPRPLAWLAWLAPFLSLACGGAGDGDPATGTGGGSGHAGQGTGASTASGGASSGGTSGNTGGGLGGDPPVAGDFRYGINLGSHSWGDGTLGGLAADAGATSARVKMPEYHFAQWGDGVEEGDMQSYASDGLVDLVGFLIGPSREHSTAPAHVADWELDHYLPANLYEPIFLEAGHVNPENYWAAYVERMVQRYGQWVRTWEVWNEPDWVDNWEVVAEWAERAPTDADVPRFNAGVFEYVRLLRVTFEVVKKLDPTALVALGGIGYPTYLDAILRYTDNPSDGSVSGAFPAHGAAYFDVVNFHYYPLYGAKNSDGGANGLVELKQAMADVLEQRGTTGKLWHVTETGAPHELVSDFPGGVPYAHNYLLKAMVVAQRAGLYGVDWFFLDDGAAHGASTDPYAYMGLYEDLAGLGQPSEAELTTAGTAYATLSELLREGQHDPVSEATLQFPGAARGVAFRDSQNERVYVLWAATDGSSEQSAATIQVPATDGVDVYTWDYSKTRLTKRVSAVGGSVSLELSGTPIFVRPD